MQFHSTAKAENIQLSAKSQLQRRMKHLAIAAGLVNRRPEPSGHAHGVERTGVTKVGWPSRVHSGHVARAIFVRRVRSASSPRIRSSRADAGG